MKLKLNRNLVMAVMILGLLNLMSCGRHVLDSSPAEKEVPAALPEPEVKAEPVDAPTPRVDEAEMKARVEAIEAAARKAFLEQHVRFAFDSHVLDAEAEKVLVAKAAWLKANPRVDVIIEGHCDSQGPDAYNQGLGLRRAEAVGSRLESLGIDADRMSCISLGENLPLNPASTEAAFRENRRVQFKIQAVAKAPEAPAVKPTLL
ncbi:MAG: OmpA family protein [Desulfobacterales bacterium]|nr:OmpA family protein [Desulfobacterales bacterium]